MPLSIHKTKSSQKSTNTKHKILFHSNPTSSSVIQHFWFSNNTIAGQHRSKRWQREIEPGRKQRKRWKERERNKGVGGGVRKYPFSLGATIYEQDQMSLSIPPTKSSQKSTNIKPKILFHSNPTSCSVIRLIWLRNNMIAGPHRSKRRQREIENERKRRSQRNKGVGEGGWKYPFSLRVSIYEQVQMFFFIHPTKSTQMSTNTKPKILFPSNPTSSSVMQHFWLRNNTVAMPHRSKRWQGDRKQKKE
ncbi:hypothetical protein CDAR_320231 [Caerostris darwini]|uniref:Uncharacterized protein n=1 Tax=Caerostris darwini TaxID=1538125 RepID=A0AAV4PGK0_9ARAC|nr:hypothetical protein CDAR_320231 [Caerostris darwini]